MKDNLEKRKIQERHFHDKLRRHSLVLDRVEWHHSSPGWWINFIVRLREDFTRSMIVYATENSK